MAVMAGRTEIVRLLLDKGAAIDAPPVSSSTFTQAGVNVCTYARCYVASLRRIRLSSVGKKYMHLQSYSLSKEPSLEFIEGCFIPFDGLELIEGDHERTTSLRTADGLQKGGL